MKKIWFGFLIALALIFTAGFLYFLHYPYAEIAVVGLIGLVVLIPILLKEPAYGIMLIGFCLPLERIPTLELGGMTLKVNHFLIIMTLIAFALSTAVKRKMTIPRDPLRFFIALFIALYALSVSGAINLSRSFQVMIFMFLMGLIYLAITLIIDDKEKLTLLLKGLFWGALVSAVFGLFQFLGDAAGLPRSVTLLKEGYDQATFGFARIQSFAAEPLYYANYIFIPLLITLFLLLKGKFEVIAKKSWGYAVAMLLLLNFVLTVSRGAYLGLVLVALMILVTQYKKIFTLKIVLPIVLAGALIITGVYLGLAKSQPRAIEEFVGHVLVNDYTVGESVVSRLSASDQAIQLFQDHMLLGVGPGNFGPATLSDPFQKPDTGWPIVNNEYLELLAESGIIGFASFMALIAFVFYRSIVAYRKSKDDLIKAVLIGGIFALVGILVQYATFSTLTVIHVWFLIGLLGALSNMVYKYEAA